MKKVTVYSTPTCSFCVKVKKFLADNNVEYENIDVSTDQEKAQEMIEKTGQMAVPVIMVDEETIIGFDKTKLSELLGIK